MSAIHYAYNLAEYRGSTDYARLAELARERSIICFLDYRIEDQAVRDVARTQYMAKGEQELWSVCARGFSYITAFNETGFMALCKALNLAFIEPPPAATA